MAVTTVTKEISLNVAQPNNFELFCAMQEDNLSYQVVATLYDENELYTINGSNIKLKGLNPLNQRIEKNIDSYTTNTITFTLDRDLLEYDGILKLVLVITSGSTQITTFPFIIKVVNRPGNTANSDFISISDLVRQAQEWANLSKSYAIGTNGQVRSGDATDNSKYYSEQSKNYYNRMKELAEQSKNIVYYETYDEFINDYNDDKIKKETLVLIKENIFDPNGYSEDNETQSEDDETQLDKKYFYKRGTPSVNLSGEQWNTIVGKEYFNSLSHISQFNTIENNQRYMTINETENYLEFSINSTQWNNIKNDNTSNYYEENNCNLRITGIYTITNTRGKINSLKNYWTNDCSKIYMDWEYSINSDVEFDVNDGSNNLGKCLFGLGSTNYPVPVSGNTLFDDVDYIIWNNPENYKLIKTRSSDGINISDVYNFNSSSSADYLQHICFYLQTPNFYYGVPENLTITVKIYSIWAE